MWECPNCGGENPDSGLRLQACQECSASARVHDAPLATTDHDHSGWVTVGVVLGILVAAIAWGPGIVRDAKEAFANGANQISSFPGLSFESFDDQIDDCVQATGTVEYDVIRTYEFPFNGRTWTWTLPLSKDLYECLSNPEIREGYGRFDYAQYVTARFDDEAMGQIVAQFREVQQQEGYDDRQLASMILAFVQHLTYATDDVTAPYDEWPRFPLETLYVQGGDCEDTSILYASLIKAMGYGAVLLAPPAHMAVGLPVDRTTEGGVAYGGAFYAFAETTGEGYQIGQMPEPYVGAAIRVYML